MLILPDKANKSGCMNYFEQQARSRRRFQGLTLLFVLAAAATVAIFDGFAVLVLEAGGFVRGAASGAVMPATLLWTSLVVIGAIVLGSMYRINALSAGGGASVAAGAGGSLVAVAAADPARRNLRAIVEELAIASGVPVPQVFVLERETAINAFAAGYSPADAALAVTRGALDWLSAAELRGVVAHEFSHIVNGDMRLNIRLMGLLYGILAPTVIAQNAIARSPRGVAGALLALPLFAVGAVGAVFARLIKAVAARGREFAADAQAAQLTRQPQDIASALQKTTVVEGGSRLRNTAAEELAHMLFGDGVGYSPVFATHPPVPARILALEPQGPPPPQAPPAAPAAAAPSAAGHYDCAGELHRDLPWDLLAAARDPQAAEDLIYGLLLNADPAVRERQLQLIEKNFGPPRRASTQALASAVGALHPAQRLPLAAIAIPSLRQRPRDDQTRLVMAVTVLMHAGGAIEVFEFCLGRMLRQQIGEALHPGKTVAQGRRKLEECAAEAQCLLSAMAQFGQDSAAAAQAAYMDGASRLGLANAAPYAPLPAEGWSSRLDKALNALDELDAGAKECLVDALCATVRADARLVVEEAELLRAVCAALHCPLPPLLNRTAAA
jgi:Zn-dependent protease with chaperone function